MREALSNVRHEMGPEAVIVASERTKGGGIMVRAALDQPDAEEGAEFVARELASAWNPAPASFETSYRDNLVKRDRPQLLSILMKHRAPDALAHELAEAAEKSGLGDMTLALASALDRRMKTAPLDIMSSQALLLAGCPGAGKTAVAAKIAAHARLSGRNVEMIAADTTGAGAVARLETFSKHVGAELVIAESAELLSFAVANAAARNSFAIVDTAGFDPRHSKARTAFSALGRIDKVEIVGVVSAANDAEEAAEIAASLVTLGAKRIVVTGLDLARRAGGLLAAATQGADLAHVTRSPYVAGGLETLTPLSLSRHLIESSGGASRGSAQ
jgi:flagellar biosynthesis protein FlhF